MRVKPLDGGKRFDCRLRFGKIALRERDEAVTAAEVIGREAVEHVRGATRWKHMARPCDKVASGLRRPRARKDRARAPDALHHLCGVLRHYLEVLGRETVDYLQPLGDALRDDDEDSVSVNDALDERLPRKRLGLAKNLVPDLFCELLGSANAK